VILHRRLQGLGIGHAVRAWLGIILASVVMAAVVWGWIRATASQPVAVVALGGVGLGLAAYVLVAGLLRVPEVRALPRALLASRRRSGRPEVNDQR
jgi:hypothetical protein